MATSNTIATSNAQVNYDCLLFNALALDNETKFIYGPPSDPEMVTCSFSGCRICPNVWSGNVITGYTTNKQFGVIRNQQISCIAKNVIYLITCKKCGIQYVGETKRTFRQRMNEHRNNVLKSMPQMLYNHFRLNNHCQNDMEFTILETLENNTPDSFRRTREDFWIRALVTAYPFGLNDKIDHYGTISNGIDPINHKNHPYFCIKFPARIKPRGKKRRSNKKLDVQKIDHAIAALQNRDLSIRELYIVLQKLSLRNLHQVYKQKQTGHYNLDQDRALVLSALAAHRFGPTNRYKPPVPKMFLTTDFPNKGMELIMLHTIFLDRSVRKLMKVSKDKLAKIIVSYRYKRTIGSLFLTQCKELRHLDVKKLDKILQQPCMCENSSFFYPPAGHVVTGDMDIIPDSTLRQLFQFGTNYRIPEPINWHDILVACEKAIQLLIEKLSIKFKIPVNDLKPCYDRCMKLVNSRIQHQQSQLDFSLPSISMGQAQWRCLKWLKSQFIIAPADKAANNFIFICKKYYMQCLCSELGVVHTINGSWIATGNSVYVPAPLSLENIIDVHEDISADFGVKIKEEDKTLPMIFAIPKLHKTPYKFRFIAGARKSSMKSLSILLTRILSSLKQHHRNYCNSAANFSGTSMYWSVDSSLEALYKVKRVRKPKSITSADFSTLYTSLPHKLVQDELWEFVYRMFSNSKKQFLCLGYKKWFYTDTPSTKYRCFTKEDICQMIQVVLNNTYVTFAGFIFQQISGIPMGGNASPLLADMTLSALEFKFLKNLSPHSRVKMGMSSRYIDDLLNINGEEFMEISKEIYPISLPLEETTASREESNFLDINLKLDGNAISTTVYNKVDEFNFDVIRLPESSSNIHSSIGYNTFYSQIIHFARICSNINAFECKIQTLCSAFISKGFGKTKLRIICQRFCYNYKTLVYNLGYSNVGQLTRVLNNLLS